MVFSQGQILQDRRVILTESTIDQIFRGELRDSRSTELSIAARALDTRIARLVRLL